MHSDSSMYMNLLPLHRTHLLFPSSSSPDSQSAFGIESVTRRACLKVHTEWMQTSLCQAAVLENKNTKEEKKVSLEIPKYTRGALGKYRE